MGAWELEALWFIRRMVQYDAFFFVCFFICNKKMYGCQYMEYTQLELLNISGFS